MYDLITCKYEKGSDEKQPRKSDDFVFPIISLWDFFSDAQGQPTP